MLHYIVDLKCERCGWLCSGRHAFYQSVKTLQSIAENDTLSYIALVSSGGSKESVSERAERV